MAAQILPPTHWSVVAQSALTHVPEAEKALGQLCETYWPPIYSFIRRRGYSPADGQDLTQSFFAFFLRTKAYARTDPLHGKFRSFLLVSVKNFLADNWDRDQAVKRGRHFEFVSLDQQTAEAFYDATSAADSTAESLFDVGWAKTLTSRCAQFIATGIAGRRPDQNFRTTKELSYRWERSPLV
jgi:DNA-directed RNA polymerase specialized sigma24 family protein